MRILSVARQLVFWTATFPALAFSQISQTPSQQLVEQLSEADIERRRDAMYELVRRGESTANVVDALAAAVTDGDMQVRFQALLGLSRLGPAAAPAIEELIAVLDDRDDQVRYRASDALGKIGPAALPALAEAWTRDEESVQVAAARAVMLIGPPAADFVPRLQQALTDELPDNSKVREAAAQAIAAIVPRQEAELLQLASHADAGVRQIGIVALASFDSSSKEVTQVLQQAAVDSDPKIRETAILALAKSSLPKSAKADLLETALTDSMLAVRAAAIVAIRKAELGDAEFAARLANRINQVPAEQGDSLLRALTVLGPQARGTLTLVLQAAKQQNLDDELLIAALASFGELAVPDLLASLETAPELEPLVSQALARIGEPAVAALLESATSNNELVRRAAYRGLGGVRPLRPQLVEQLQRALSDPSPTVRSIAVGGLIAAGPESATTAQDDLFKALDDNEAIVRAAAIPALTVFEFPADSLRPAITRGLHDAIPRVRTAALTTVGQLDEADQHACLEHILERASDDDVEVRRAAASALGKLNRERVATQLLPIMVQLLADADGVVRIKATETSMLLQLRDASLVSALSANLTDDLELMPVTLRALASCGKQASELAPQVSHLLQHARADIRMAAIETLAAIADDSSQLAGQLTAALDDSEWEVRRAAAAALAGLGPAAKPAVPKLYGLLSNEEDSDFASGALREIDAAPVEAVPVLVAGLDSEERRTAFYAVFLLGKIGPEAASALPKLEALLSESSSGDRSDYRQRFLKQAIASIRGEPLPEEN